MSRKCKGLARNFAKVAEEVRLLYGILEMIMEFPLWKALSDKEIAERRKRTPQVLAKWQHLLPEHLDPENRVLLAWLLENQETHMKKKGANA